MVAPFTYPSLAGGKLEDVGNACRTAGGGSFERRDCIFPNSQGQMSTYHSSVGQNTVQIGLGPLSPGKVRFQFYFPSETLVVISRGQSPVPNRKVRNVQWSVRGEQIVNVHAHYYQ